MKPYINVKRTLLGRLPVFAILAALLIAASSHAALADSSNMSSDNSGNDVVVLGGQHQTIRQGQEVSGDLVVIGGSADVLGKVDGDAVALGGRIYIAPQGHVNGSLVNLGGVIDNRSSTPQSRGGQEVTPPVEPTAPPEPVEAPVPWYQDAWNTFFFFDGLLVLMAFLLFPNRTRTVSEHLVDNPVMAGMLGFFSPIIFALLVVALAITIIGIPLIPLALLVTLAGYLLGKAAIAEFIGSRILDVFKVTQPRPIATVGLGVLLLFLLSAATGWIGIVVYFCIAALAIGASLYMLTRTAQTYRRTPSTSPPVPPSFSPPADPSRMGPPAVS
ncbi:MAG TPA: hypothetical protein VGW96_07005 [Candidatus Eremiobacteraceae bacterium]|nr:hypothetical protein [Candidatus Eremiobacteraceae bacterium]